MTNSTKQREYFDDYDYLTLHIDDNTDDEFIANLLNSLFDTIHENGINYAEYFSGIGRDILLDTDSVTLDFSPETTYHIGLIHSVIALLSNELKSLTYTATREF